MKPFIKSLTLVVISIIFLSCTDNATKLNRKNAADILGNPDYLAISYGGYRHTTRDIQPTMDELKEDLKILNALDIKIMRTYHTKLKQASNLLEAIHQLKEEDPNFEMYVMLGAWIDCENAWTDKIPNHESEDEAANTAEVQRAVNMANAYPNIVKVIAVGNEAMVHWAETYFVRPKVILKYVNQLQDLKKTGKLSENLWITSSDNFASWGGGDASYHTADLTSLIKAVDYVSMHTYPFHDTHYNPTFWYDDTETDTLSKKEKINAAMQRAKDYAISQYQSTKNYMDSLEIKKPIHIGETGWASISNRQYGPTGSKAADEYKEKLFYDAMREWTNNAGMSCFYFEAFDEPWKDAKNPSGSENHFGLIDINNQVKYVLWDAFDQGIFEGLTRNNHELTKSFDGDESKLLLDISSPIIEKKSELILN